MAIKGPMIIDNNAKEARCSFSRNRSGRGVLATLVIVCGTSMLRMTLGSYLIELLSQIIERNRSIVELLKSLRI